MRAARPINPCRGFWGVVRQNPDDDSRDRLLRPGRSLSKLPVLGGGDYVVGPGHLVACCRHWEEFTCQNGCCAGFTIAVAYGGHMAGYADPSSTRSEREKDARSIASVLRAFAVGGERDGLEAIDGTFLLAKANPATSTAVLVRDKFGIRPLYYLLEKVFKKSVDDRYRGTWNGSLTLQT